MFELLNKYLIRKSHVKLAAFGDDQFKKGPKDSAAHALERLMQRGNSSNPSDVAKQVKDLIQRLGARPESIRLTGADGKIYSSSAKNVSKLPNQIGLRFPGQDGYVVLENRRAAGLPPNYTFNTVRTKEMGLRQGTVAMGWNKFRNMLVPETKDTTPKPRSEAWRTAQPERIQRDFGYRAQGKKAKLTKAMQPKFEEALKAVAETKKNLPAERAALGLPELAGEPLTHKPGPVPTIAGMSKNRARKFTRAALALASKGKLKLGFINALRQSHLQDALAFHLGRTIFSTRQ